MTKTNFSLLTLALLTSTSVMARVIEPSFTVESAIHTYKINADVTYELTEEVITRINTHITHCVHWCLQHNVLPVILGPVHIYLTSVHRLYVNSINSIVNDIDHC